jgi:hypothetical protein
MTTDIKAALLQGLNRSSSVINTAVTGNKNQIDTQALLSSTLAPQPSYDIAQMRIPSKNYLGYKDERTPEEIAYYKAKNEDPEYKAASDAYYQANNNPVFDQAEQLDTDIWILSSSANWEGDQSWRIGTSPNKGKTVEQMKQELDALKNSQQYKDAEQARKTTGDALSAAQKTYETKNPPPPSSSTKTDESDQNQIEAGLIPSKPSISKKEAKAESKPSTSPPTESKTTTPATAKKEAKTEAKPATSSPTESKPAPVTTDKKPPEPLAKKP